MSLARTTSGYGPDYLLSDLQCMKRADAQLAIMEQTLLHDAHVTIVPPSLTAFMFLELRRPVPYDAHSSTSSLTCLSFDPLVQWLARGAVNTGRDTTAKL